MASELYKDILKDKDNLNKSNPRTRSFGGLTSSDYDYKNYLAGMRPRTKSNNTGANDVSAKPKHSSFVDSAARVQQTSVQNHSSAMHPKTLTHGTKTTTSDSSLEKGKNNDTKSKHSSSSYSELSAVPLKKTFDAAPNNHSSADGEVDFNSLKQAQSDNTGSVGRLRSMFDKTPEVENKPLVQLRGNRSKKERPHSASFDQMEVKSKNKMSGIYDRHSMHFSPLQADAIVKSQDEAENKKVVEDESHKHKININSILAPEEPKTEEKENEVEEELVSPREEQKLLLSNLEVERMRRTQEEVQIEKRFHIKRRSLKERLSELAADESEKNEIQKSETVKTKIAPPVAAKPDVKHDGIKPYSALNSETFISTNDVENESGSIPENINNVDSGFYAESYVNINGHVDLSGNVNTPATGESKEITKIHQDTEEAKNVINDVNWVEKKTASALKMESANSEMQVQEPVSVAISAHNVELTPQFDAATKVESTVKAVDLEQKVTTSSESHLIEAQTAAIPRRDSDEFKSEVDKYKSAVERFDDFLNNQEGFSLDDQDPLKDFPNDFTPEDNSKLFSDDISVINVQSNLKSDADKANTKEPSKDEGANENDSGSTDLMNSILKHMEQSNKSTPDGQEYVSFLRTTSKDDEVTESPKSPPQNKVEKPIALKSPEAPPRLSKLQGRMLQPPVSPPTTAVEEPVLATEEPKVESVAPERPSSLSISLPNPVIPVMADNEDSDSDHENSGYYSLESAYNTSQSEEILQNSNESGFHGSYHMQNGYYENHIEEEFTLPPPPAKSNITKTKHDKKRKVGFKDGNIQQVTFTYGPAEYDRANADIDPMASSAEWELEKRVENMDIFSVDLQKDERGLGLSIIGLGVGTDSGFEKLGIFVKTLTEKGAAQKDGRIQVNDQILEVNGVSLVGVTQFFAAQTLKGTSGVVRFLMGREKSKRTQFSPGAPILENPEMKKHIEEMNKTIAQLEDYENRAHEAERTLEDVKMELLKAEERAHEAEQNLRETKDMLKAATEGGKRNADKVDDLQRSLKEVTNRLSASEENLLELTSKYDVKDKEIEEFQQRLQGRQDEEIRLAEDNEQLKENLKQTNEELEALKDNNEKMKTLLQELTDKRENEVVVFRQNEKEYTDKIEHNAAEYKKRLEDLNKSHETIKQENKTLKQKLAEIDLRLNENTNKSEHDRLEQLEMQLRNAQKTNAEKEEIIMTLKDKIEYYQELLTKVERSSTDRNSQIESQYITENTELKLKIKQLEHELSEKPSMLPTLEAEIQPATEIQVESVNDELSLKAHSTEVHTPNLPKRENVHPTPNHIFGIKPPLVDRHSKPLSPPVSPTSNDAEISFNLVSDETPMTVQAEVALESAPEVPDVPSDPNEPNPIPKPPRGHFISDEAEEPNVSAGGVVGKPVEIVTDLPVDAQPVLTSETTPEISALASVTIPPPPSVDLNGLPEDKIDDDSVESEDQGQFQLIQEDIDEEKVSLNDYRGGSERRHTSPDTTKDLVKIESQEFFDSSFSSETWVDDEWKRLDHEKQAELIAEQVVAQSPVKRKISNASSSSEEGDKTSRNQNEEVEIGRTQSIKIDSSYFEKSRNFEDSFDHEVSILDDEEKNQGVERKSIKKSISFDSAIPATPILDSRMAQDKLNVKNKRKPPTKVGRKQMLESNENLDGEQKQSSLPRNLKKDVALHTSLAGAKSVPNLSTNHDSPPEKSDKHKHRFEFHLPKLFKKSKLAKRSSHDKTDSLSPLTIPKSNSASALERPKSPQVDAIDIEEVFSAGTLPSSVSKKPPQFSQAELQAKLDERAEVPVDGDVVPMREKAESMSHERANEVGTEEAVVPFHQKEQSMLDETQVNTRQMHVTSEESSPSLSPDHENTEPENTLASPDDVTLELSAPSSSSATSSLTLDTTESSKMPSPTFGKHANDNNKTYNERGIDVGTMENGHVEEENTHWTKRPASSWDVRQVGLWLVEINLNQYVNSFKFHNVDGQALLRADGNKLKEYGVHSQEDRAEIKRRTKEIRNKLGKDSFNKGKTKDHKTTKGKLQFWKGKYKPH